MKQCTMNCGQATWDKRSREQMMAECDDCIEVVPQPPPCNPAEDGVCEALECCKHGVDDGACKECYDDTTLLRHWEYEATRWRNNADCERQRADDLEILLRQALEAFETDDWQKKLTASVAIRKHLGETN